MDSSEKRIIVLSIVLLALFTIAIVAAVSGWGISVPDCITDVQPFEQSAVIQKEPMHYEIHMVARMWFFDPPRIEIPEGATVDLYLTSIDVVHGLHIDDTDVNLMAIPGQISYLRVKFDKAKEYKFLCHEYCGIAHQTMAGTIVVKPAEEMSMAQQLPSSTTTESVQ